MTSIRILVFKFLSLNPSSMYYCCLFPGFLKTVPKKFFCPYALQNSSPQHHLCSSAVPWITWIFSSLHELWRTVEGKERASHPNYPWSSNSLNFLLEVPVAVAGSRDILGNKVRLGWLCQESISLWKFNVNVSKYLHMR